MQLLRAKGFPSQLFATTVAVLLTAFVLVACGGGGGTPTPTPTPVPTPTPTPTPLPQATLSSVVPASGATGVARDVKPVITLTVTNATASDGSKLALTCASRVITFTVASALSTDAKTITVTLTPQANAILAGDNCTLAGDVTTTGAGGTAKTPINASFSIYAAPVAKGLSLIAGTADNPGSKDGGLLDASFDHLRDITVDAQDNIYVGDGCPGNHTSHAIYRKISSSGVVTTITGSTSYYDSLRIGSSVECNEGITLHPDGNLYAIGATYLVEKISLNGQITAVAGALGQRGSVDGIGTSARLDEGGITVDPQGNLFVTDYASHTIRKVDSSGNVTTYADLTGVNGSADGSLQSARFTNPWRLKYDKASGKLFVGDANGIRVIQNGTVSTVIPVQQLVCSSLISGLDVFTDGRLAVAFGTCRAVGIYQNNKLVTKIGDQQSYGDADGSPETAKLTQPMGVGFLANGDLLIADVGNSNIKRFSTSTNTVVLFAGKRSFPIPVDGIGSAAKLSNAQNLYRSDLGEL